MNQGDLFTPASLGQCVAEATKTVGPVSLDTWQDGDRSGTAIFSPCRRYRYVLTRRWADHDPFVVFIGLNPSTATAKDDDPTIRRCIRFTRDWGFGHYVMLNAFAFRATDPKVMLAEPEPIGAENDRYLADLCGRAGIVIAAWGVHCGLVRAREIAKLVPNLQCLGLSKEGHPRHPLYMPANSKPQPYALP